MQVQVVQTHAGWAELAQCTSNEKHRLQTAHALVASLGCSVSARAAHEGPPAET